MPRLSIVSCESQAMPKGLNNLFNYFVVGSYKVNIKAVRKLNSKFCSLILAIYFVHLQILFSF